MRSLPQHSKLLLSSFGFNSPIMRTKFSKVILQNCHLKDKTCFIIPYAGFNVENTFKREKQSLIEFGFSPEKIEFANKGFDKFSSFPDYLYVPGGNPFKLLKSIREIGIFNDIIDCVRNKGTVYIGVSAGADIATENIEYVKQLEDNNDITDNCYEALGLISENVLCHYDHYSYLTLKVCREISRNSFITINDDQLLKFENGEWKYVGEEE